MPFFFTTTQERPNNKLKDFLEVSSALGVTHLVIFNQTEAGTNLRFARVPRGPTLCFKLINYSLVSDVRKSQPRPKSLGMEHKFAPLLVLNNFGEEENHLKLASTVIQNMFPSINVGVMKLADARRVAVFNYNSEKKTIDFRHYTITVAPVGLSKSVKRIIQTNIPDLGDARDISEYILKGAAASESDAEDLEDNKVELPQRYLGRGNTKDQQRAVKLVEIGPRLEMKLIKVQKDLCGGEVLFHDFSMFCLSWSLWLTPADTFFFSFSFFLLCVSVQKTPQEIKELNAERMRKLREKEARRKEQEANVERKEHERELHRLATGKKEAPEGDEKEEGADGDDDEGAADDEDEGGEDQEGDAEDEEGDGNGDQSEGEDEEENDEEEDDGEEEEEEGDEEVDPFEQDYLYKLSEKKDEEDDDAVYYREAVGEEPGEGAQALSCFVFFLVSFVLMLALFCLIDHRVRCRVPKPESQAIPASW